MRHTTTFALAVAAALTGTPASAAVNLIKNGDFSIVTPGVGQISGGISTAANWTTSGYNFVLADGTAGGANVYGGVMSLWTAANWKKDPTNPLSTSADNTWNGKSASGTGNFLAMDGDFPGTGGVSVNQTVSGLTAGDWYTVTFDYAFAQQSGFNGSTVQHITFSLGNKSETTADYTLTGHGFSGWMSGALNFQATASTETFSITPYGNVPVPPFALVSDVKLMAAPEPATWAMMGLGFAGLGFAGFRSRRTKAAIA